jgi:hypothetical protein
MATTAVVAIAASAMVLLLAAAGCAPRNQAASVACRMDVDCGAGYACTGGACLPRDPGGRVESLAVEILPRTDSASADTEILGAQLGPDLILLSAEKKLVVAGTISDLEATVFSDAAHLIVTAPSRIPGRGELRFETDVAARAFQIGVPQGLLGRMATVRLYPPVDRPAQPPVTFTLPLAEKIDLPLPRSDQMAVMRGRLVFALGDREPAVGFLARAYLEREVVSNIATTDVTGAFELRIPRGNIPASYVNPMVSIEFQPPASGMLAPRLSTTAVPIDGAGGSGGSLVAVEPPTYRMPAFGTPGPLRFVVMAGEVNSQRVVEATVRFRTEIPALPSGTAVYSREASTDRNGEIEVMLIPGTAAEARLYEITVIPPPNSPYAVRCAPKISVTSVGATNTALYGQPLMLERKARLEGTVTASDGAPAASVGLAATRISDGSGGCSDSAPTAPVIASTDRAGYYLLQLDPGTYRLDVDPPAGAPLPRLTVGGANAVTVAGDMRYNISLPAGTVLMGTAAEATGVALVSASIRVLAVICPTGSCGNAELTEPPLRAQARTDMTGQFRLVMPLSF